MTNYRQEPPSSTREESCTLRQHFNYLRNNSSAMRDILSSNEPDRDNQQDDLLPGSHHAMNNMSGIEEDQHNRQKRNVSFNVSQNVTNSPARPQTMNASAVNKKAVNAQGKGANNPNRNRSVQSVKKKANQGGEGARLMKEIREKELEQQGVKKEENRQKVKDYISGLKFTRQLPNSKYQDYFDKAALQCYGRANVKNANGGVIYANHLKTFNANPHTKGNEPKYYQTHQTAINHFKATKLSEDNKWVRLEKELCNKLGLKDKNESLKAGKQLVEVEVDDSTIHSVMKQNLQFQKKHRNEIRALENEYKVQVEQQKKAAVEQFYAQKRERIQNGNSIDLQKSTYVNPRDEKDRLQEQVVYKHTDKDGNVRFGTDLHSLHCFVDRSFPENDAAYTRELVNRQPIYPVEVEEKDKCLDQQRKTNYVKSKSDIYPSHYLVPNVDQPEVIKMLNSKYGEAETPHSKTQKDMGSTRGTQRLSGSIH